MSGDSTSQSPKIPANIQLCAERDEVVFNRCFPVRGEALLLGSGSKGLHVFASSAVEAVSLLNIHHRYRYRGCQLVAGSWDTGPQRHGKTL